MYCFSILTITFQCERFIRRCYYSVRNQTYKEWEWIIIDDGSTDNTKAIVEGFRDKRIRYIQIPKNIGRGRARNFGLSKIRTEWCIVLDMDDLMFSTRIERANIARLEGFDFMVSSTLLINDDYSITGIRKALYHSKPGLFTHATLCIKTDILKSIGYSNSRYAEDQRIIIIVKYLFKGKYESNPLYIYHENASINFKGAILSNKYAFFEIFKLLFIRQELKISGILINYMLSFFFKYISLHMFYFSPILYKRMISARIKVGMNDNFDFTECEKELLHYKNNMF